MPGLIVAVAGDLTDPTGGVFKNLALTPPGTIIPGPTTALTVLAMGRPVAVAGSLVTPHGNPTSPPVYGYNPTCACATILGGTIPNILVEGRPIAVLTSTCTCGHFIVGPGAPTVLAGII
jgi:uncharacterized Zn-binding protein involved in type VI secretion